MLKITAEGINPLIYDILYYRRDGEVGRYTILLLSGGRKIGIFVSQSVSESSTIGDGPYIYRSKLVLLNITKK